MSLFPQHNNTMVACVLVLDCSASMSIKIADNFTRMDALKGGVDVFSGEVASDDMVRNNVEIAVISIGGKGGNKPLLIEDWSLGKDFRKPELCPSGSTPLGESLLLALEMTGDRKKQYRQDGISYLRPWIILITDGEPTDGSDVWQKAVIAAKEAEKNKAALILGVGVDGCPLAKLNELTSLPAQELSSHKFSEFFVWLSNSLSATSQSLSDDAVAGKDIGLAGEQLCSTDPWRNV